MEIDWSNRVSTDATRRPIVFVSSTVYDKKDMLDYIRSLMEAKGWDVRMSHSGTVPADSADSAYQNCLDAVRDADFFIGIISPSYGSGIISRTQTSITHEEMRLARELKLPRLMLVDERVKTVADFLNHLGFRSAKGRLEFKSLIEHYFPVASRSFASAAKICDIRSVGLYDEMLLGTGANPQVRPEDRRGNWIQEYRTIDDFKRYLSAQFTYIQVLGEFEGLQEAASLIRKNIPDLGGKGAGK